MRLKIISDGTVPGTKVVNVETGEEIERVQSIEWKLDAEDKKAIVANVRILTPFIEIVQEAGIVRSYGPATVDAKVVKKIRKRARK